MSLLALPDDVLSLVVAHVMDPLRLGGSVRVVEHAYMRALPLATSCKRLARLVDAALVHLELWQSGRIGSNCVASLARRVGPRMRRLVLRGCTRAVSQVALDALAKSATHIRILDLSHTPVQQQPLAALISALPQLAECRLRGCESLGTGTAVLSALGNSSPKLQVLDVSHLPLLTELALRALFSTSNNTNTCTDSFNDSDSAGACTGRGNGAQVLRTLCISRCVQLGDSALEVIATRAKGLRSLTARGLPRITNTGISTVCGLLGSQLATLDVLDCDRLHADAYLEAVRTHCPRIAWRVRANRGRSLRQVVISALAGNIFYVTGSDICNGKAAVYFLLVDAGTADSFRVSIGSSSLDLTNFGSILASCFGDRPSQHVKDTMLIQYGLDLANEDDDALVPIRESN